MHLRTQHKLQVATSDPIHDHYGAWILDGVFDATLRNIIPRGGLSQRQLSGKGNGGRGYLDLLLFKHALRDALLDWGSRIGVNADAVNTARQVFADHATYRAHATTDGLSWRSSKGPDVKLFYRIMEGPV